ncbi:MAG TPA: carboxypeptidase regulatory-like domain-containing protein [Gemmatimonadaceae bacterium]
MAFAPAIAVAQQTGSVQGVVLDSTTGQAVPNVQVSVTGTTLGTLTSSQGRFRIDRVPAGAQRLRARRIGFFTATRGPRSAGRERPPGVRRAGREWDGD